MLLFGFSTETKAATYNEDWVNWSAHSLGDWQFPVVGYKTHPDAPNIPWMSFLVEDENPGIIVKYYLQYWYFSFSNTPTKLALRNNITGDSANYTMTQVTNSNINNILDGNFGRYFSFTKPLYYYKFTANDPIRVENYDLYVSGAQDLYNQLDALNFENPERNDSGDLPFLHYDLEKKIVPVLSLNVTQTKEIFTWDYTEKEPYSVNPSNYTFDICAWANFHTVNGAEIFDPDNLEMNDVNKVWLTNGGYNISTNQFSFLYQDVGSAVYQKSGKSFTDDSINSATLGYILAIRTRNNGASEFSYWKLYKVQAGGYVISTGKILKPDGNITNTSANNGDEGYTTQNQGSGGVARYSTDNSNSAEDDPTSTIYDGTASFNIGTVIANLRGLVNSISEIPQIMAQLLTVLPSYFVTIFVAGLTLLIAIGVVKIIVS